MKEIKSRFEWIRVTSSVQLVKTCLSGVHFAVEQFFFQQE